MEHMSTAKAWIQDMPFLYDGIKGPYAERRSIVGVDGVLIQVIHQRSERLLRLNHQLLDSDTPYTAGPPIIDVQFFT